MVSHAFCTSTSRMALRETFLRVDLEPRVATSLAHISIESHRSAAFAEREDIYQTVATPYLRDVSTKRRVSLTRPDAYGMETGSRPS